MQTRPLVTGVDKAVSELALGTAFFELARKDSAVRLLDAFVAQDGTVVDSAHGYGDSESVIGAWLAARGGRERVVLVTKGGLADGLLPRENLDEVIETELALSLRRLQTDYIDLYLLHRDNPAVPVGPIVECLNGHLARGRIRAFGGSNWQYERVDQANDYASRHGLVGFAAVSNTLSLAPPAAPFYPGLVSTDAAGRRWHAETRLPLFSWSSQARGFFTGRFRPGIVDRADAFARRMLEVYCTEANLERLRRAEQLGRQEGGYSAVQVALAWVLHQPISVVPIVGPRTQAELASCFDAMAIELSPRETRWLNLER